MVLCRLIIVLDRVSREHRTGSEKVQQLHPLLYPAGMRRLIGEEAKNNVSCGSCYRDKPFHDYECLDLDNLTSIHFQKWSSWDRDLNI